LYCLMRFAICRRAIGRRESKFTFNIFLYS